MLEITKELKKIRSQSEVGDCKRCSLRITVYCLVLSLCTILEVNDFYFRIGRTMLSLT